MFNDCMADEGDEQTVNMTGPISSEHKNRVDDVRVLTDLERRLLVSMKDRYDQTGVVSSHEQRNRSSFYSR